MIDEAHKFVIKNGIEPGDLSKFEDVVALVRKLYIGDSKMPEFKVNEFQINILKEFEKLTIDGVIGTTKDKVDYIAYLTERVTQVILEGRPDLAESFMESAKVRAAALRLQISNEKSAQIASFAGIMIRILAGVLL